MERKDRHNPPPLNPEKNKGYKEEREKRTGETYDLWEETEEQTPKPSPIPLKKESQAHANEKEPKTEIVAHEPAQFFLAGEGAEDPWKKEGEEEPPSHDEQEALGTRPPPIKMPRAEVQKKPHHQPVEQNPTHHIAEPEEWESPHGNWILPTPPRLNKFAKWKTTLRTGIALLAGIFGIKIATEISDVIKNAPEEKTEQEDTARVIEMETASPEPYSIQTIRVDREEKTTKIKTEREEAATKIHTLKPGDSLWGIAEEIITEVGARDTDGTLSLRIVKALREKNEIKGDPTKSKKMWVGEKIDLSSAYDLVVSEKYKGDAPKNTEASTETQRESGADVFLSSSLDLEVEVSPPIPQELISPTLNTPGETIWSRAHEMLESLNVKPNLAKRSVLTAIVLKDSGKSEMEAMRAKHRRHKKFDETKDTLNFTRAALAAQDLANGMSPAAVAKKYGVANVYERLRAR